NLKELKEGLKIEIALDDQNQIHEAVEKLRSKTNIGAVMITLSEKGIYIANAQEKHLLPAHLRMVSDVSGAGDTVISIAALGMALKLSLRLVADLANLGGGIVCEYLGVVPIKKEQLLQEAIQHQLLSNT
ncbi:MAG: PfkB family carbohydrate kinase, partial [Bacteroidetes bacterium]|nr:PfkB family carbohydrate kinase [Bacteroidota bacterium]